MARPHRFPYQIRQNPYSVKHCLGKKVPFERSFREGLDFLWQGMIFCRGSIRIWYKLHEKLMKSYELNVVFTGKNGGWAYKVEYTPVLAAAVPPATAAAGVVQRPNRFIEQARTDIARRDSAEVLAKEPAPAPAAEEPVSSPRGRGSLDARLNRCCCCCTSFPP